MTLFDEGKIEEAIETAHENVNQARRSSAAKTTDFAYALTSLGSYLSEEDNFAKVDANLIEGEAIYRKLLGDARCGSETIYAFRQIRCTKK